MNYEHILETYTLEEIIEENECTEAEVLEYLVKHKFLDLPMVLPVDVEYEER